MRGEGGLGGVEHAGEGLGAQGALRVEEALLRVHSVCGKGGEGE